MKSTLPYPALLCLPCGLSPAPLLSVSFGNSALQISPAPAICPCRALTRWTVTTFFSILISWNRKEKNEKELWSLIQPPCSSPPKPPWVVSSASISLGNIRAECGLQSGEDKVNQVVTKTLLAPSSLGQGPPPKVSQPWESEGLGGW